MLGTTLWLIAAIALVATALLDAGAALARASVHAAAGHAAETALHDALAGYQNALGAAIARDDASDASAGYAGAIASLPSPLSTTYALAPPASGGGTPAATIVSDVVPTTLAAPACTDPSGAANGPDTVAWLQCGGGVAESRLSLRVTVRALDPNGAVLAQRAAFVTLRLFALPPYSAVVGAKDGDAAAPLGSDPPPHEGDAGGDTISGAAPSPQPSPWPAGGTLIHVRFECHDGAGSCANAAPPDPDAGLRADARWQNGNAPPP